MGISSLLGRYAQMMRLYCSHYTGFVDEKQCHIAK